MIPRVQKRNRATEKAYLMRFPPSTRPRLSPPIIYSVGTHGSLPLRGDSDFPVASFVSRSEGTLHIPEETFTDDSSPPTSLRSIPTLGSSTSIETKYSEHCDNATTPNFFSPRHQTEMFQDSFEWSFTTSFSSEPPHQDHLTATASPYNQTSRFPLVFAGNIPLTPSPISMDYLIPGAAHWHLQHQDTTPGVRVSFETFLSPRWPWSEQTAVASDEFVVGLKEDNIGHSSPQLQMQGLAFSPDSEDGRSTSPNPLPESPRWPSVCLQCSSSCHSSGTLYKNRSTWLVHYWTVHSGLGEWPWSSIRCPWEDPPCATSKCFETTKGWLDHVRIVHLKAFFCDRANCNQRKGGPEETAFGTTADLKRHHLSIHETPIYCLKPYCKGRKKAKLNRKDKRDLHEFKHHGRFSCNFDGCPRRRTDGVDYGFSDRNLLNAHIRDKHHRPPSYVESD
jgi:hypothetical protein